MLRLHYYSCTHVLWAVLLQLLDPHLEGLEGLAVGDIVDDQSYLAILVVDAGDSLIPFLSGGVPELKLDFLCIELVSLFEVDGAEGGIDVLMELVMNVPDGNATFTNSHCPHDHHLHAQLPLHHYYNICS